MRRRPGCRVQGVRAADCAGLQEIVQPESHVIGDDEEATTLRALRSLAAPCKAGQKPRARAPNRLQLHR